MGSGLRVLLYCRKQKTGVFRHAGFVDSVSTLAGIVAMTGSMALWNMLFTPMFMGVSLEVVMSLMPFIVAFNMIKAAINSIVALTVYKLLPKRVVERIT